MVKSINFSQYIKFLDHSNTTDIHIVESSYHEATRVMSQKGLSNFLEGMSAMCTLGSNKDLVFTYIQEMPEVVGEIGEDILPEIVHAMMKLSSHTSASVIILILSKMPLIARRLGDTEVVRGYLKLLHNLAGKAPRGLRPMMENLDELSGKLTLGGLRRWALWGAQVHARDIEGQMAYFALGTESSRSVLQNERRGTLFVNNHRKLNYYLRALWGRSFFMRPTSGDYESREGLRPYIEKHQIHLPDAFDAFHDIPGSEIFRACAAHCAAHLVYTQQPIDGDAFSDVQKIFVGLFEDARVEYLAIEEFPGLMNLWRSCFDAYRSSGDSAEVHETMAIMLEMAYALLDANYRSGTGFVNQLAADFRLGVCTDPRDKALVIRLAIEFYDRVIESLPIPSLRVLETLPIPYRDDNRYSWDFSTDMIIEGDLDYRPDNQQQLRRNAGVMEMVNNLDCELAGDDAQEIWTLQTPFWLDQEACTINELEGKEPVSEPYHYDEWDYRIQLSKADWATVIERRQPRGDPKTMDEILIRHKPIASRIRHLIDAMQPKGIVRRRGYEEGEELDLDAAVRAMIDIRRGVMPDPRINIRITRHVRDLAIVVLMDLSESTNQNIGGISEMDETFEDAPSVLSLAREATGLLSWAIDSIGDAFAVHGFASNGRHDVQYFRFKDFDQAFDDEAKSRMAGMRGGLSTRMGTALRHANRHLQQQNASKRLVLLLTDGEPADIDERDPQYLRQDTKKAVEELATQGVYTYCMTLDQHADQYVSRIFGENNYSIVDDIERLPERLPAVFSALTA
jgi:nitric oxide reductase NorD protein